MLGNNHRTTGSRLRREPPAGETRVESAGGDSEKKATELERKEKGTFSYPGYKPHHHMTPEAAATIAVQVDAVRTNAAVNGKTLVYTIKWI